MVLVGEGVIVRCTCGVFSFLFFWGGGQGKGGGTFVFMFHLLNFSSLLSSRMDTLSYKVCLCVIMAKHKTTRITDISVITPANEIFP